MSGNRHPFLTSYHFSSLYIEELWSTSRRKEHDVRKQKAAEPHRDNLRAHIAVSHKDEDERRIRTEAKKLRRRIMDKSLTDDELFRIAMFDNTELADFFARCYVPLYEPGSIESVKVDYEIPTAVTKSSRLDAYAEAGCTVIDFEMESARRGSIWNRSRQYVANLTNSFIIKGDGYRNLARIVVVFFIPYDILGKGKPFYVVMPKDEDGDIADPGDVRIYVNWNYDGDDEYGRIAHDIRCVRPEEMYHEEMRARVLSLKAEIGGEKMAEDYYSRLKREWTAGVREEALAEGLIRGKAEGLAKGKAEGRAEGRRDFVRVLLKESSAESVSSKFGIPLAEVKEIARSMKA